MINSLNVTHMFVILLFGLIELDKRMYKKLDEDYKKFTLKDRYSENEEYYDSNRLIQVIKNIENHTNGRDNKTKFIGFVVLLLIIYFQNRVDRIYSMLIIKILGIFALIIITMLGIYGLIKGIMGINEFKKKYNKEHMNIETLYVILRCFYFLIAAIVLYI